MPPTPSTGPISFLDIIAEFGNLTDNDKGNSISNPDPVKLGAYRTSVSYKNVSYPLDEGVPTSGTISFGNLRDKRLNIIVKVDTNNTSTQGNAKSFYDANQIAIVGNGRDKKFKNTRIHIVVTGTWGSVEGTFPAGTSNSQTNRNTCAIRTGSWTTSAGVTPTSVDLRVGGSQSQPGYIIGGGGRGGNGGASDGESDKSELSKASGHNGCIGTSGLGLDIPLRNLEVRSPGRIQAGCGGGGGGGGAGGELGPGGDKSNERAGGGGGGGGSGIPGGQGGEFGYRNDEGHDNQERDAKDGASGNSNTGGNGGRGADNTEEGSGDDIAQGGGGGGGGGINQGAGGDGTEGAFDGEVGESIDSANNAETSGEGGPGGKADAEGTGQQEGLGGAGGQHGLAIDVNGNAIGSITGSNRIYGRYNLV